ncbi:Hypothetical predicted protein [Mytilus galloprovincialis]|uniref:Uncharacterized protein n=1 Tax=Mytilus galloprovincialis TaxID=29158 RepID=A0A8B6FQZ8_MYTGA|nr:Hypothetical predicted protein [Mytilus galloprovincialis]
MKVVWLHIFVSSLCIVLSVQMSPYGLACDPRDVRRSCLMGCLGCFEAFGGSTYNLAACCYDCKITDAVLIDDGPTRCSSKYLKPAFLSRFGK